MHFTLVIRKHGLQRTEQISEDSGEGRSAVVKHPLVMRWIVGSIRHSDPI